MTRVKFHEPSMSPWNVRFVGTTNQFRFQPACAELFWLPVLRDYFCTAPCFGNKCLVVLPLNPDIIILGERFKHLDQSMFGGFVCFFNRI